MHQKFVVFSQEAMFSAHGTPGSPGVMCLAALPTITVALAMVKGVVRPLLAVVYERGKQ